MIGIFVWDIGEWLRQLVVAARRVVEGRGRDIAQLCADMWRWAVLWPATSLLLVGATFDFRYFNQRRQQYTPSPLVNCYEYSFSTERFGKSLNYGWRPQKTALSNMLTATIAPTFPTDPLLNLNEISKRIDHLLPGGNDIVKEHAKLVQDINGLRQVVFVAPIVPDDNRDYEDSIFHEIIETSTTTTQRPTTTKPRPTKSIPVILAGGASQRQVVKSQPLKFPKPTISLVGTSISPSLKHPYPFVMQTNGKKPAKLCMPTIIPMMYMTTTKRPSLWQRLLSSLIPR